MDWLWGIRKEWFRRTILRFLYGTDPSIIFLYVLTCLNYIQFGLGVSIHSKATVQTVWASWPRITCVPSSGATSIGKRWWRSKPVTSWKKIQCGLACEVIQKEPFCNNMCTAPQPRTKKHIETTPLSCWPGHFLGKIWRIPHADHVFICFLFETQRPCHMKCKQELNSGVKWNCVETQVNVRFSGIMFNYFDTCWPCTFHTCHTKHDGMFLPHSIYGIPPWRPVKHIGCWELCEWRKIMNCIYIYILRAHFFVHVKPCWEPKSRAFTYTIS